jgi:hypothetical protein
METSSIIIGITTALLFLGPIAYVIIQSASKEKRIKKTLEKLCATNEITLSSFEVLGNTVIGIDELHKKLIISNTKDLINKFEIVDLKNLKHCHAKTIVLKNKTIDVVELELIGDNFVKDIVFYKEDEEDNPITDSQICLNHAQKWEKTIQKQLLKVA